jgi:hypothetical protein
MIEVFFLMAVVYWLTRKRVIADIAARAPLRAVAGRETFALIAYSVAGQVGGWIVSRISPIQFSHRGDVVWLFDARSARRSADVGIL